jgi:hypothetical protein
VHVIANRWRPWAKDLETVTKDLETVTKDIETLAADDVSEMLAGGYLQFGDTSANAS